MVTKLKEGNFSNKCHTLSLVAFLLTYRYMQAHEHHRQYECGQKVALSHSIRERSEEKSD